jgi:hypothetical protein
MDELLGAKNKNPSNGGKKDRRRPLFFAFDAVVLNSRVQCKKQQPLLPLIPIKNQLIKNHLFNFIN